MFYLKKGIPIRHSCGQKPKQITVVGQPKGTGVLIRHGGIKGRYLTVSKDMRLYFGELDKSSSFLMTTQFALQGFHFLTFEVMVNGRRHVLVPPKHRTCSEMLLSLTLEPVSDSCGDVNEQLYRYFVMNITDNTLESLAHKCYVLSCKQTNGQACLRWKNSSEYVDSAFQVDIFPVKKRNIRERIRWSLERIRKGILSCCSKRE